MRATKSPKQPAKAPAAIDLEAELDRIAAMNINELRSLWRERQGREREKPNLSKRSRFRSIGERHVRWLTPLAFLSPKIVTAIVDESAPADFTVAMLVKALPHSWAAQNESHG